MAEIKLKRYKIKMDPEAGGIQGLRPGDIVRRQYFQDLKHVVYSLMYVNMVGVDDVDGKQAPWFAGTLLDGDVPQDGEVLDFVRVTSLTCPERSGAMYLTANGSDTPFMDVIDRLGFDCSICFPEGLTDAAGTRHSYGTCPGTSDHYRISYQESVSEEYRRQITFQGIGTAPSPHRSFGVLQRLDVRLSHPDTLLIVCNVFASRDMDISLVVEYEDGTRMDAVIPIHIAKDRWNHICRAVTIDNSGLYRRAVKLDINDGHFQDDEIVRICDMNIIPLSGIATFVNGVKTRIGNLEGIVDPVFGKLGGYGAYIKRLYATSQVNIAGTLTAGDENGNGCNFYAGRIHRNVVLDSLSFGGDGFLSVASPVGAGHVYQAPVIFDAQRPSWVSQHMGEMFCFSVWVRSVETAGVTLSYNQRAVAHFQELPADMWTRIDAVIKIGDNGENRCTIGISSDNQAEIMVAAPQMEYGNYPTQYQPTDGVLDDTDAYGAWFNRGGVGGTMQNPLLKFHENGSITSRNGAFQINPDGSGKLAGGKVEFDREAVTLHGLVLKWEDFDPDTQAELRPKSVKLVGENLFVMERDSNVFIPSSITLQLTEIGFTALDKDVLWYYWDGADWVLFDGIHAKSLSVLPEAYYWKNGSPTLTVKCEAIYNNLTYSDTITIQKHISAEGTYTMAITSSDGIVFKNGIGTTVLTAHMFKGNTDITSQIPGHAFSWKRRSGNVEADEAFNAQHYQYGRELMVEAVDVADTAQYDCEVEFES